MIGAISSAVGGSLLGMAGSQFDRHQDYKYAKRTREQGPSQQVAGLRKAGLNPILATGSLGGVSSAGSHSSKPADVAGSIDKVSSAELRKSQQKLLNEQKRESYWRAEREKYTAMSADYKARMDADVRRIQDSPRGQKVLPRIKAFTEAGGFNAVNSAAQIAKMLF